MGICKSYITRYTHKLFEFRPLCSCGKVFNSYSVICSHGRGLWLANSSSITASYSISTNSISNLFRSFYKNTLAHKFSAVEFLHGSVSIAAIFEHSVRKTFPEINIADFSDGFQQGFKILLLSLRRQSSAVDSPTHGVRT